MVLTTTFHLLLKTCVGVAVPGCWSSKDAGEGWHLTHSLSVINVLGLVGNIIYHDSENSVINCIWICSPFGKSKMLMLVSILLTKRYLLVKSETARALLCKNSQMKPKWGPLLENPTRHTTFLWRQWVNKLKSMVYCFHLSSTWAGFKLEG